ncbi:MAG: hypothetical protein GY929_06840 [Actinomycetia bacterium]|nr:hypothetical protein [Actinomycetes bacterium]
MILAELEIYHSRSVAPTRRVAVGDSRLPVDPAPGPGGLLLAIVVASGVPALDDDLGPDLARLIRQVAIDVEIPQPRLRHRFQADRVGLHTSTFQLVARSGRLGFDEEAAYASPAQRVLGAIYAVRDLPRVVRPSVCELLQRAATWRRPVGPTLFDRLASEADASTWHAPLGDPMAWALDVLRLPATCELDRRLVRRQFRQMLRDAHPDHGAEESGAADRIADLTEARRILLAPTRSV